MNLNNYIIFEDNNIIVVNKPNNLLVHHSHYARNIHEKSLTQLIRNHLSKKTYPIHRLDRKTSGVIVFAKDALTAKEMQTKFENFSITKEYIALTRGYISDTAKIDTPIKNDEKGIYQEAETNYHSIEKVEFKKAVQPYSTSRYSIVKLIPKTGRTHQLRKHMNKIAHPIIGDPKHGNRHHNHAFKEWFNHSQLYLHARRLCFSHPLTNEKIVCVAEFPDFWKKNIKHLGFKTNLESL